MQCTDAVVLYNKFMAGVDKGDQLRQYYRVRTKCLKNYKYIFWFLLDVAITNAYILSFYSPTQTTHTSQRLKAFRLRLAEQLIGNYCSRRRSDRPAPSPSVTTPTISGALPTQATRTALHLPSYQERRQCVYCSQYRTPPQRRRVVWYCTECAGKPALCLTGKEDGSDCFRIWHARLL